MDLLLSIAKERGYDFTIEELKEANRKMVGEISDDELLNVAGGLNEPDRSQLYCKGLGVDM